MKLCPTCRREYFDDSLAFCFDDGAQLTAPAGVDEPTTAILPASGSPAEASHAARSAPVSADSAKTITANSVAVLPFVNMSADPENEYFCDGLAEELLNALAKIDDLKVAARTASFSFRGKNAPMDDIGNTLNVRTILEGSVRKAGDRVRITVQLINASDGYHLWSERFDRNMNDIFEIQDEITLAVVDALKVKLLGEEKQAVLRRHTNDPEAYQLYLRGRHFFYKRTPEGFLKAIECFEKAIDIDKDYAVAVSGLADSWVFLGYYEMVPPGEAAAHVRPLVERVMQIDDTLTESNTSYALMKSLYDYDHIEAQKYFQKAIASDPKYAFAYHLESAVSAVLGDFERAFAAEKRAIELDPFTPVFNASLAWWYYVAGQNDLAIAQCKRTIDFAPNHFFAYWVLGMAYAAEGAYSDAVVALQQGVALNQFEAHVSADLGRVFGAMGEQEAALEIVAELKESSGTRYVAPSNFAKIYMGLGEDEKAIEELERACQERAVRLAWVLFDPIFERLSDDPRFADIRHRAGLPKTSTRS
jgi:serine/threonine-protein kinase